MKDDLVERLSLHANEIGGGPEVDAMEEAIACILSLREALEKIAEADFASPPWDAVEHEVKHTARAALSPRKEDQQPALKEGASREG